MAGITLYDYQYEAVEKMKNGCILCGGVGSGKSRTGLAYYYRKQGGKIGTKEYSWMENPKDLYIITTARKRDTYEWEHELAPFILSTEKKLNGYSNKVTVDSWNNIKKYSSVTNSFFIFDEQRVVGSGAWVSAFLRISRNNEWILLSATPGDTWEDYIPVFVANGFYKNRTEFKQRHMVITWVNGKFPKVSRYLGVKKLERLRNEILIEMDYERPTEAHHIYANLPYDVDAYKQLTKKRWNPITGEPIVNASELCYEWRRIANSDKSRINFLIDILKTHLKLIIFYNFNYELDILRNIDFGKDVKIAEWNGHKHEPIPTSDSWVYLVQYTAGAEGWNCVETNTIVFYSQTYSYKTLQQAAGRIDRLNTPYKDLYYYHLISKAPIDIAISRALKEKKKFNERKYVSGLFD